MKNLFKILTVLVLFFGSFAFGQKPQNAEEVKHKAAEVLIGIKNGTRMAFESSKDYVDFKIALTGSKEDCPTKEGENLLLKVYDLHLKNISDEEILKTYDGKELAYAIKK